MHALVSVERERKHNLTQKLLDRYEKGFLPRPDESQPVKMQFFFELINIRDVVSFIYDVKPWPNGTPNSIQLARKPFKCLATTAQPPDNNKTTWQELAGVGRGVQTVENLARVRRKFELDQIQANSIQLEPSG